MVNKRFVVGVDGSLGSGEALRWAGRLARAQDGEIVVVHALGLIEHVHGELVPAHAHRDEIANVLEFEWCGALRRASIPFSTVLREGHPLDVLPAVARETNADLVVLGSRGIGSARALTLGSTSLRMLQRAAWPVLVTPEPDVGSRHLALQRILVGVDSSEASSQACDMAIELAGALGSWVTLLHVQPDQPPPGEAGSTSSPASSASPAPRNGWLRELTLRGAAARDVQVQLLVRRGDPAEVVCSVAADLDADLVAVGARGGGDPAQPLLGSVSRQVTAHTHRPTLVVPEVVAPTRRSRRDRALPAQAGAGALR